MIVWLMLTAGQWSLRSNLFWQLILCWCTQHLQVKRTFSDFYIRRPSGRNKFPTLIISNKRKLFLAFMKIKTCILLENFHYLLQTFQLFRCLPYQILCGVGCVIQAISIILQIHSRPPPLQ